MSHEIRGNGSLVDFLVHICRCLLISESHDSAGSSNDEATKPVSRPRSLRANQVPDGIRYDKSNHWPLQCEKPQRCKWDGCAR